MCLQLNLVNYSQPKGVRIVVKNILSSFTCIVLYSGSTLHAMNADNNNNNNTGITTFYSVASLQAQALAKVTKQHALEQSQDPESCLNQEKQEKQAKERNFIIRASEGNIEALQALLAEGININAEDEHGNTALMIAARFDQATAVEFLLRPGARTDVRNRNNQDARALALSIEQSDIAELLLEHNRTSHSE